MKDCTYCGREWPEMLLFAVDGRCPKCQVQKIADVRAKWRADFALALEVGNRAWRYAR